MSRYVDLAALGEVILFAFVGGVGLVLLFSLGTVGVGLVRSADGSVGRRVLGTAMTAVGFAAVAAGVVLGLYVILKK